MVGPKNGEGLMKVPHLSGALDGLKVLETSDLPRYKKAVENGQQMGWGYYFPYLLSYNRPQRSAALLAEEDGSMCIFIWHQTDSRTRLDLAVAPTPINVTVLHRCLERANDYNGDSSARVLRIDAKDVDAVSSVRHLRVRRRRMQYLYAPRTYTDLGGRKYQTIRRNVGRVESMPDVEVVPYAASHAEACQELLRRWRRRHRQTSVTKGAIGMSRRGIELTRILSDNDLRGEVVLVNGRLSAFAFGGEIRPGLGCSFDRRSDPEVRGLSYFSFRSLLLKLQDFDVVNDGSDAGRSGLRQLKDSFRPIGMHEEYRATQLKPGARLSGRGFCP